MLTEYQIEALPERISERLHKINTEYLEEIGRVVKEIGEFRASDVHKIQRIYKNGGKVTEIVRKLAKESEKNIFEIYDMFDIVAKENYSFAEPFFAAKGLPYLPYEENKELQQYVKSLAKQTVNEYVNLTQHTAFAVFSNDGKSIAPLFDNNKDEVATSLSDTYTKVIDYAVTKVQTGVTDYQSAMREVMKAMADSGIRTVDYATGYSRRLESAVRQNILWGVKQCNQNTADMIGEQFGADGYEISYHSNPRPSHADMGGKQYAIGPARMVNGKRYPSFEKEAEPLLSDYGCLHFKFSILLVVSRPAYSEEQLAQFKAEDNRKFEFEGKKYSQYEASQLQKRIESEVRRQKDRATIAKAAGDDEMRREAQYKINLLTNKYAKLSKESGLPTKMERMKSATNPLTKGNSGGRMKAIHLKSKDDSHRLPNAISAATIQPKIQGYFLNSNHPVGKHKARVLNSVLGYHYENWEELSDILFDAIQTATVMKETVTEYGIKYKVPIRVIGRKHKSMVLNTVWQIDKGSNIPRFITTTFDKRTIKEVK